MIFPTKIYSLFTTSTAQGGGASFKNKKPIGEVGWCESHEWQSESTDGPKGGWSCVFLEWLQWLRCSPHPQLLHSVWCGVILGVAVVVV